MDAATAAQTRERLARWLEDAREIFTLLPELLQSGQQALVKLEHAERDTERLRRELMELRKELSEAKERAQNQDLEKQVDELRKANEELKAEKDEAAQAFAKLIDTVQSTNQIAQKLGVTKSPFARSPQRGDAPPPAAAPQE